MKHIDENIVILNKQEWFNNQELAKISLVASLYPNQDNSSCTDLPSWLVNKTSNKYKVQNYYQYKKYEPLFINEFNKLIYNETSSIINKNILGKFEFDSSNEIWLTNDEYINKIIKVVISNNNLFINLLANKDVENTIDLIINNVCSKPTRVLNNDLSLNQEVKTAVNETKDVVDNRVKITIPLEEYEEFKDLTTPIKSQPSLTTTYASTKRKVDFIVNQNQSIMVKNIDSNISVIDDLKIDLNSNWYLDQEQLNQLKQQQDDLIIKMVNEHQQALLFETNLYIDNNLNEFNKALKNINIEKPIDQKLINELNLVESNNDLLSENNDILKQKIKLIRQRADNEYYQDEFKEALIKQ